MNENDADMVDESKALREELQASKDEYARQEQIAADKAAEAKAIQEQAQAKVSEATELMNSLDAEAKELLEQEQAAAAAAAAAEKAAAAEAARQAEQAANNNGNNNGGGNGPVSPSPSPGPVYPSNSGGSVGDYSAVRGLRHESHRLPVRMGC